MKTRESATLKASAVAFGREAPTTAVSRVRWVTPDNSGAVPCWSAPVRNNRTPPFPPPRRVSARRHERGAARRGAASETHARTATSLTARSGDSDTPKHLAG